jgi:hypothetical protein
VVTLKPGWTIKKVMDQIRKRNGFTRCVRKGTLNTCVYRENKNPTDRTCIAGAFIPDDEYKPEMEGVNIETVFESYPDLVQHMPLDIRGMGRLQRIHDSGICNGRLKYSESEVLNWLNKNVKK